jgi:hypothetical protein
VLEDGAESYEQISRLQAVHGNVLNDRRVASALIELAIPKMDIANARSLFRIDGDVHCTPRKPTPVEGEPFEKRNRPDR